MDAREAEERRSLLAVACPWCRAPRGETCTVPDTVPARRTRRNPRPIRSLPHGSHDARWLAALGRPAPVAAPVGTPAPSPALVGV